MKHIKDLNQTCTCRNVEIGSYDNQVELKTPKNIGFVIDSVYVDKCCVDVVLFLWDNGIKTYGCCCGHGTKGGFVNVGEGFSKAIALGFSKYTYSEGLGGESREDTIQWGNK